MISSSGRTAALAVADMISEDAATAELGARRFLDVVKPEVANGAIRWDVTPLIEGVRIPLFCLAYQLAENLGVSLDEVLAALRADVEACAMPDDLGELEAVWSRAVG